MKRRKALGLGLDFPRRRAIELRKCLPANAAGVVAPGTGHGAVDEERADRLRHPRREDARPVLLGEHAGPTYVDEQDGVPGRQEPNRRRSVGWRERRAREVEELAAGLVAEAPEPQPSERRAEVARLQSRPTARCRRATRGRTRPGTGERGGRARVLVDVLRPDPALGRARSGSPAVAPTFPTVGHGRDSATVPRTPSTAESSSSATRPVRQEPAKLLGLALELALVRVSFRARRSHSRCGPRIATASGQ